MPSGDLYFGQLQRVLVCQPFQSSQSHEATSRLGTSDILSLAIPVRELFRPAKSHVASLAILPSCWNTMLGRQPDHANILRFQAVLRGEKWKRETVPRDSARSRAVSFPGSVPVSLAARAGPRPVHPAKGTPEGCASWAAQSSPKRGLANVSL